MAQETQREPGEKRLLQAIFSLEDLSMLRPTIVEAGRTVSLKEVVKELLDTFLIKTQGKRPSDLYLVRRILVLRFGLEGNQPHSIEAIRKNLRRTKQEEIRQLESIGLRFLRHPSRSKRLRPFLEQ